MRSLFIVFDGLDGSGKGEMIKRLSEYLKEKGHNILLTREPTDGQFGRQAREILQTESDPLSSSEKCLQLFIKDRKEHIDKEINPAIKEGKTVICDRYYYSTIAFQHTQGIDIQSLILVNMGFKTPDITFILDLPATQALDRIHDRGLDTEKFEEIKFMKDLRQNFLNLKKKLADPIEIIDASKTKDEVFEQIKEKIDTLL